MRLLLLIALLLGFVTVVYAGGNSVEVTLEDTPDHQQAPETSTRRWRFAPLPEYQDSDSHFEQWDFKFRAASDNPLGTARDTTAIKALVPSTMLLTIRWVSRSIVVVAADCHPKPTDNSYCLYVLEKQHSKWKLVHHYSHRRHPYTI